MSKTIVVLSDTQIPFEDTRAVSTVIRFIKDYQPDEVVHIGDVMDFPQPSRWTKDTRAEFEGSIFKDAKTAKNRLLSPLREAYGGPIKCLIGNHDERPANYLEKYAPALAETREFDVDRLLDFDGYGIETLPAFYEFAPNWLMLHGHIGVPKPVQDSGKTAVRGVHRTHKSVVMGHTHRAGILPVSFGYDQKVRNQLFGVEVGNLMDMSRAQYLNGGAANWQQGFGVFHVDGKHVQPNIAYILNGKFIVEGETYEVRR